MAPAWLLDHTDATEGRIASSAARLLSGGGEVADRLARARLHRHLRAPCSVSATHQARVGRPRSSAHPLRRRHRARDEHRPRRPVRPPRRRAASAARACPPARRRGPVKGHADRRVSSAAASSVDSSACPVLARTHPGSRGGEDRSAACHLARPARPSLPPVYLIVAIPRSRHLPRKEAADVPSSRRSVRPVQSGSLRSRTLARLRTAARAHHRRARPPRGPAPAGRRVRAARRLLLDRHPGHACGLHDPPALLAPARIGLSDSGSYGDSSFSASEGDLASARTLLAFGSTYEGQVSGVRAGLLGPPLPARARA